MRKQSFSVSQITGGLKANLDPILITDKESPNLRAVRFDRGLVKKDLGARAFGTGALDGYVMFMDSFPMRLGSIHYLFATPEWVYRLKSDDTFEKKNSSTVKTGTVTVTNGSATVVGVLTAFTTELTAGDTICFVTDYGVRYVIESIESNTALTLTTIYGEVTTAGTTIYKVNPFIGDEENPFSSVVTVDSAGDDIFILTNGVDPIMKWDGGGNFVPLVMGGLVDTTAKFIISFKSRLILGWTTESGSYNPTRIRWSVAGDVEDFDITHTGAGVVELIDTPDWITGFCLFKDKLLIIKERSIWELVYVGGTKVFTPVRKIDGVGAYVGQSVISLGEQIVFLGSDNVYLYDTYSLQPIGDNVFPLLFEASTRIVNMAYASRIKAAYIEELEEYWLSIPTQGSIPDTVLKYNFSCKSWTLRKQEVTAFGYYEIPTGDRWLDEVGNWTDWVGIWVEDKIAS